MAKKSIANRWFVNSFSVVAALLLILDVTVFFMLQSYYYRNVSQHLLTEANIIQGILAYIGDYSPEVRRTVEEFDKKNQMELMAITAGGDVAISSSGFTPQNDLAMPDFDYAMTSVDGHAEHTGYLPSNEKYMAVTVILQPGTAYTSTSSYAAIRVVTSLDKIDMQIYSTALIIGALSIGVLLLVLFLGLYFVKSIVSPLKHIGVSARRLAAGDYSKRIIPTKNDDEVSELCRIFNHLADELENSETIKNDFISSVSHELRTPLTAIRGWSETLIEDDSDNRQLRQKGMTVIMNETKRLAEMVEELLDFSRIQSGRFTLKKSNMDVIAELGEAILVYAERAHREGVTMTYIEPEEPAVILGDKNRIRQVFINIIDNAVKYSAPSGAVIVEADAKDGRDVVITVTDNGCGISSGDLPRVKQRFFKANMTVRGSGIGLAVADEIITTHGGSLSITSEQGAGTVVRIVFPLV